MAFLEKNLKADYIRFVSATMTSLMVFSLYSMVDGLMVSLGVNEYAMSAVNLTLPYTNLLFSIAVMFAVGTSTLISFYLAQQKRHEADVLFSQNLAVLACIGLGIMVLVYLWITPFARLLGADDVTLEYAVSYLHGLLPFSVCYLISYNLEILIKGDGYPRFALFTVIMGCLTNCVLDYIAIFLLDMGTFGAAAATGVSQLLTCVLYLSHFLGKKCSFRPRKFRFDPHIYKRLLPIGFADGVTELCTGLMIFLFNRTVLRCIGTDGVVTYTVIAYVNTVVLNLMMGIPQGSQPLVSFYYGKGELRQSLRLLHYGLVSICVIGPAAFLILQLFAPQIVGTYLSRASAELISDSVSALRHYSISYLLLGVNMVIGGFMTAIERPVAAITISVGRGFAIQSAVLLLLAVLFGGSALWYTPVISESICLVLSLLFLHRFRKENLGNTL